MTAYSYEQKPIWSGSSTMSVPIEPQAKIDTTAAELSGFEINQNGAISGTLPLENNIIWQTFRFPADFARGVSGGTVTIPKLSGFHVNVEIEKGAAAIAGMDWFIDYYSETRGWVGVTKGTAVGAPEEGRVWFPVTFEAVDITNFWWLKFRLGIMGREVGSNFRRMVSYDQEANEVTIESEVFKVIPEISASPLTEGQRYFFNYRGHPSMLEVIGGNVYFSEQQGITSVFYTTPNPFHEASSTEYIKVNAKADDAANGEFERIEASIPFATPRTNEELEPVTVARVVGSDTKAYQNDGITPFIQQIGEVGAEMSIRFRILSTAPDTDRDCTGSVYRTVTQQNSPASVKTSVGNLAEAYWLSGPNPSQFACEALYFDLRDSEHNAQVIDHLVIDPITPGIWMNVYYSNDPVPGVTTEEWDGLLWNPIPKQFVLRRKESFAMPEPIIAKYVKLEFTRLQPVWYSPGQFQRPTQYRKHPSWVYNYYFCLYEELRAATLEESSSVNVSYDALELAYDYYLEDIKQDEPNAPTTVTSAEGVSLLSRALTKAEEEEENTVDSATLGKINLSMERFKSQPAQQGSFQSLLQSVVAQTSQTANYPVEQKVETVANTSQVSSIERDNVVIEKGFPITQFYLECRHYYAIHEAEFEEARGYFAGIKEVAFTREHYEVRFDNEIYIDVAGDGNNIETNDLLTEDHTYVTYTENAQ